MSAGLDTSVVVRLLIGEPSDQAGAAWAFVSECAASNQPVHVSELVVAEAFFVLQHHYAVPLGLALKQLSALLTDSRIATEASALKVLQTPNLASAKPGFVDRLIHGRYLATGNSLVTFDRIAARLPGTRLLKSQA